jgi:hypothetical protein
MKLLPRFALILFACYLIFPVFAQQPGIVVLSNSSKELKRAAHRLRIPVEQMKNARQTLQEATDLAKKIEPSPIDQYFSIVQSWTQLDRSKSKIMLESLVQDLRSEAASCEDYPCYQRATSVAMSLMQSNSELDYEKTTQWMRNWPEPKASFGEAARSFRESMETQVKRQSLLRLAGSDPDKALSMLPQLGDASGFGYTATGQIAQSLMNAGKRDEALQLIDQTIRGFDSNTADARTLQDYENFVRTAGMNLDPARASTAVSGLVTAIMNQPPAGSCGATLKAGATSIDLTCTESRVLNLARSFPMRPGFVLKTLDSVPGLKSKLDVIGGIDGLYGGGGWGGTGVSISYYAASGVQGARNAVLNPGAPTGAVPAVNIANMIQELRGKDSAYTRSKLKDLSIDVLINMAMNAAYQDPDVGSAALEIAQQLLPQVEPLQRRASSLQSMVQAYRQVEGEVDPALLKNGFVLADELKQELSEKAGVHGKGNPENQIANSQAGQLEAFLVAELSRTSYESAIRYVRSMENNALKVTCLLQIVQALSQPNF